MPTGLLAPTEITKLDEPEPGAAIAAGPKLAMAPDGKPAADSAIDELKFPERLETIVDDPTAPWAIVRDVDAADNEKVGPKVMSMIG